MHHAKEIWASVTQRKNRKKIVADLRSSRKTVEPVDLIETRNELKVIATSRKLLTLSIRKSTHGTKITKASLIGFRNGTI